MADLFLPAVVDALVVRLNAAPAVTVAVFDGPEADWSTSVQDLLAVGLSPENFANPSVREPAGLRGSRESVDVTCLARAWGGSSRIKTVRDRAYELLGAATVVVEADRTLGGVCKSVQVTGSIYLPMRAAQGLLVDVVFTVRARQF